MKDPQIIRKNKIALFKFNADKEFEAGIVLTGADVKSIKTGQFNITESFIKPDKNELFLWNIYFNDRPDAINKKKLLLKRYEINKILIDLKDKKNHGFVINVRYNERNKIKVIIGIGTIKKAADKKRDQRRSTEKRFVEKEYLNNF